MHLLIDGVAFQRGGQSAASWRTVLEDLAQQPKVAITLLDRGGAPEVCGVRGLPFSAHLRHNAAADALLIQRMCDHFKVDVFLSTGTTSPVATPALAILPICLGDSADEQLADEVAFAQRYICTSDQASARLRAALPSTPAQCISSSGAEPAALAAAILRTAGELQAEGRAGRYDEFFKEWTRIRRVHAAVAWNAA